VDINFRNFVLYRESGTDTITELSANGNDYKGEENVVKAFQDHFCKLATFSLQGKIDLPYHNNMVEEDIETLFARLYMFLFLTHFRPTCSWI
jgi:hypothetical protein